MARGSLPCWARVRRSPRPARPPSGPPPATGGLDGLARAGELHPQARRALLIEFGDWGKPDIAAEVRQAIADGRLRGDQLTFKVNGATYTGRVNGATITGTIAGGPGGQWNATRKS